ncbi:MAG: sodium:solute symporter [Pseudomonadota bacterium]
MSPTILFAVLVGYFAILALVAKFTSQRADDASFFAGNKSSDWRVVAFGMVGTSLSGVTFVSVPGAVGVAGFTYFQIVLGNVIGYILVARILLPIYYKLNLTSIYQYLEVRFGPRARLSGAGFFLLSRLLGAVARLYIVINILQVFVLDHLGVPFIVTSIAILVMILLYTLKGGVKTIVWTDLLQTFCMLGGLAICSVMLLSMLDISFVESIVRIAADAPRIFETAPSAPDFLLKQIVAGALITVTMSGLDQEMMQKSISVRTLADSQKNLYVLAGVFLFVICAFLYFGALMHMFAASAGIGAAGDGLFPTIVMQYMAPWIQIIFVIALVSALFPSADGALTALTSSVCIDFLRLDQRGDMTAKAKTRTRHIVHFTFAGVFLALLVGFKFFDSANIIFVILKMATFTYGPLLGMYAFGLFCSGRPVDRHVPLICLAGPTGCALLDGFQTSIFASYRFGFELLFVNGLIVFAGLYASGLWHAGRGQKSRRLRPLVKN